MKQYGGFTYLAVLLLIAISTAALAATGVVWHQAGQREKERELLFVGDQFRQAIRLYYESTPGGVKRYPTRLEDLLADPRQPTLQRYLRKIYRDPLTKENNWGIVRSPEGGIMGVYSLSEEAPLKIGNFRQVDQAFENKSKYAEWQFIYNPATFVGG